VRDGGHFVATFPSRNSAQCFIENAIRSITERLPGILVEARIDGEVPKLHATGNTGEAIFLHPSFQVSHYLGNRPAQNRNPKGAFVSAEEEQLEEAGKNFRNTPEDVIGMLEKAALIPRSATPLQTLEDVTQGDYLALIHADGNEIGKRYQRWRERSTKELFGCRGARGAFFHSMRVAVRQSLVEALNEVFRTSPQSYQLLMLGGDDLLLACAARFALPFVQAYAKALLGHPLCDGAPLTVGIGVGIAKTAFPFYRLHAMAEALADSAKRLYRKTSNCGSVVDWHMSTNAWVDDPIAERRAESLAPGVLLTGKPYAVLEQRGLAGLLCQASKLGKPSEKSNDVARSQLRGYIETLRQGPNIANLAWEELPDAMRIAIEQALRELGQTGKSPFHCLDDGTRLTALPDLVEIIEISQRFNKKQRISRDENLAS